MFWKADVTGQRKKAKYVIEWQVAYHEILSTNVFPTLTC